MYGICLRNGLYGFIEGKSHKEWTKKKHSAKSAEIKGTTKRHVKVSPEKHPHETTHI